jgi:hypothetical protein
MKQNNQNGSCLFGKKYHPLAAATFSQKAKKKCPNTLSHHV